MGDDQDKILAPESPGAVPIFRASGRARWVGLPPRMVVPPYSMVRGQPGRVVRELNDHERLEGRRGALHYLELAAEHAKLSTQ